MISLICELFHHQAWSDAEILKAIDRQACAGEDEALRKTLHHMLLTQRAFLSLFLKRPFDVEREARLPASLPEFEARFHETHIEELEFVDRLDESELARVVELPPRPDLRATLGETLVQVVMHSQWHRGQCASRLRALGGNPPTLDFLLWVKDRPAGWARPRA